MRTFGAKRLQRNSSVNSRPLAEMKTCLQWKGPDGFVFVRRSQRSLHKQHTLNGCTKRLLYIEKTCITITIHVDCLAPSRGSWTPPHDIIAQHHCHLGICADPDVFAPQDAQEAAAFASLRLGTGRGFTGRPEALEDYMRVFSFFVLGLRSASSWKSSYDYISHI